MKKKPVKNAIPSTPANIIQSIRNNAQESIFDFFMNVDAASAKESLWKWLETTVTGNFNKNLNSKERDDILCFYKQLVKVMDAVYIFHNEAWRKYMQQEITSDRLITT